MWYVTVVDEEGFDTGTMSHGSFSYYSIVDEGYSIVGVKYWVDVDDLSKDSSRRHGEH